MPESEPLQSNTQPDEKKPEATVTPPDKNEEKKFTQAELDNILKDRLARDEAKRKADEDKARKQGEEEALKKNAEWQKLAEKNQAEKDAALKELETLKLNEKKRAIAAKVGIPDALALKLTGSTDEELEEDAKSILAVIPKQVSNPRSPGITNPGHNGEEHGETVAQRKARLGIG